MDISESYSEAKYALSITPKYGAGNQVILYEKLGIYRILDQIKDNYYVKEFSEELLQNIIAYDKEKGSDYFGMLEMLIETGWNLKKVSEKMFMHYNTIKNHYHKIQDILQMDFTEPGARTSIEMAVGIYKIMGGVL